MAKVDVEISLTWAWWWHVLKYPVGLLYVCHLIPWRFMAWLARMAVRPHVRTTKRIDQPAPSPDAA